MKFTHEIGIGDRVIGDGHPAFVVAEIGINHNGDMGLAVATIEAAAAAGADAVKFQNYVTEDFIQDRALKYSYEQGGEIVTESQCNMFKRCELSVDQLSLLSASCQREGIIFHSTPTSEFGVAALEDVGVPFYKNGSDFLGHLPLIRTMAATGKPVVLATGMAMEEDIALALEACGENRNVVVLQCTSLYPTPLEHVNLRRMISIRDTFGCLVGFSDHTRDAMAATGAVALGGCWVEKHFTLDRTLPGPDHAMSSDPAHFRLFVDAVRDMEKCLGDVSLDCSTAEAHARVNYRLSCVAARSLAAGHVLREGDWLYGRPGTGVPPAKADTLIGRCLRVDLSKGDVISLEELADV